MSMLRHVANNKPQFECSPLRITTKASYYKGAFENAASQFISQDQASLIMSYFHLSPF